MWAATVFSACIAAPVGANEQAAADVVTDTSSPASSSGSAAIVVHVDLAAAKTRWDGLGGLSSGGSTRLLADYPEQQRSDFLDLLFAKKGGAAFQILKTEVGGDGDSSYGSESSTMHTSNRTEDDFHEGYETWLLLEAKKRNPEISTYCLSWTTPAWTASGLGPNRTFMNPTGAEYHAIYMQEVRDQLNVTFDYAGVWNEQSLGAPSWHDSYVGQLRRAMNAKGFNQTKIVAADGDESVIDFMEQSLVLRDNVDIVGIHWGQKSDSAARVEQMGKVFWNSENNDIDGPVWPDNKHSTALKWLSNVLTNYATYNMTATIICPLFHGWSMQYGRHNHGAAYTNDPWSGYYETTHAFWIQAQLTQLSEVGWLLGASGVQGKAPSTVVYATLVSPDRKAFTIITVNSGGDNQTLAFNILDSLGLQQGTTAASSAALPKSLQVWRTDAARAFYHDGTVLLNGGSFSATVFGASAASFTTVTDAAHATPVVPPRTSFPLPYFSDYDSQQVGQEGQYLSSAFGSFNIYQLPSDNSTKGGRKVLRQGSVGCPVGWDTYPGETPGCLDLSPFATLPSGTNWRNYNITVRATIEPATSNADGNMQGEAPYASLCGRIPVWPLRLETLKMAPMVGTCLIINATHWSLEQRDNVKATVDLVGPLTRAAGGWHTLSLSFDGDAVIAIVDGVEVSPPMHPITSAWNGVAGIGSGHHRAYFDDMSLEQVPEKGGITSGSFLLDVAPMGCLCAGCHHPAAYNKKGASGPSTPVVHTDGGWAGFVLDNSKNAIAVFISALGRYKLPGNTGTHSMNVWDVSAGDFLIGSDVAAQVNLSQCVPDVLGFCYSAPLPNPLVLKPGRRYYIVSEERAGGDAYAEMTDSATSTDFTVRDGRTFMSYRKPQHGTVSGRVRRASGNNTWITSERVGHDLDTSFGPVNFVGA